MQLMRHWAHNPAGNGGFSLMEVLVSLVIAMLGLLGVAGFQVAAQKAETESYQRAQALILMNDMLERINANRYAAGCFAFTDATQGSPYLGSTGSGHYTPANCALGPNPAGAVSAMNEWDQLLQGAAEASGGALAGAMTGARGCVSFDAPTNTYTIAVAWQGLSALFAPTKNCANGLYGSETKRRLVWTTLQVANLK
jgi:type IV pilus assembly protein PilV